MGGLVVGELIAVLCFYSMCFFGHQDGTSRKDFLVYA